MTTRHADSRRPVWPACLFAFFLSSSIGFAAADHYGQVTFGGLPVPGATVTASQGDKQLVSSTDQQGVYKLPDLADGVWTIRVDMVGFSTISQDVTIAPDSPPSMWELALRPFDEIAREIPPRTVEPAPAGTTVRQKPDATTERATTTGRAARGTAAGGQTSGEKSGGGSAVGRT